MLVTRTVCQTQLHWMTLTAKLILHCVISKALADNEEQIMKDMIDCQGPPCDVGGYYKLDAAKVARNSLSDLNPDL